MVKVVVKLKGFPDNVSYLQLTDGGNVRGEGEVVPSETEGWRDMSASTSMRATRLHFRTIKHTPKHTFCNTLNWMLTHTPASDSLALNK